MGCNRFFYQVLPVTRLTRFFYRVTRVFTFPYFFLNLTWFWPRFQSGPRSTSQARPGFKTMFSSPSCGSLRTENQRTKINGYRNTIQIHTHTENKQNKTIIMISQIEKRIRTKYGRYKDLKQNIIKKLIKSLI